VAYHDRVDGPDGEKRCFWRLPDGSKGLKGMPLDRLPLYGSEHVRSWPEDDVPIIMVEGEKAAQALLDAGFRAVGTVTGAGGTPGRTALEVLRGHEVVLWPDNDEPGRRHMDRVGEALQGVALKVRLYEWGDAPAKGDAADHPRVRDRDDRGLDLLLNEMMCAPSWQGVTPSRSPNRSGTPVTPVRFAEMPPPKPREFVVEGIVPKGHTTTIFGDGGSAKSVLALSAQTAIAGGAEKWLGRKVQHCPALYVDFELDADEQRRRAYQIARGVGLEGPPDDLLYVSGLGRRASEVLRGCLDVCEEYGVGVVVIDSLGIALEGDAEKAGDVIGFHHEYLDPFRAAGVTLLVVDHQGKTQAGERYQSKRTFGSVYKENLARSVLQVEPGDRGEGLLTVKLRQTKTNFGAKAQPFGVRLTFSEERITVSEHSLDASELAEENTLNAADRVLLVLKADPAFPATIAEKTGMPLGTIKNALTRLRERGMVEYTGEVEPHTKAREVRLTKDGRTVTGVTNVYRDEDTSDTQRRTRDPLVHTDTEKARFFRQGRPGNEGRAA
jgi:hypothetical protein